MDGKEKDVQLTPTELRELKEMLPTLKKFVENRERIDWFWSASRKWGGGAIGVVILVSTFQEQASRLWLFVRAFFVRIP